MSITLSVSDMTCEGCEDIVENAVSEVHGVESADADRHDSTLVVEGDASTDAVIDAIDHAGYSAEMAETVEPDASENGQSASEDGSVEKDLDAEATETEADGAVPEEVEDEPEEETSETTQDDETDEE